MCKEELMKKSKEELCDIILALETQKSSLIREVNKMTPQTQHIQEVDMYRRYINYLLSISDNLSESVNNLIKERD
jgi:hypothetical protein